MKFVKKLPKTMSKAVTGPIKGLIVTPAVKFIKAVIKFIKPFLNMIIKIVMTVVNIFKMAVFYLQCSIKLLTNSYRCIIFYFLDTLKYIFIYLLTMVAINIFSMTGAWPKKWSWPNVKKMYDKNLSWPNSIQNDCYRCVNKKEAKKVNILDELKKFFANKNENNSKFNFLFFLLIFATSFLFLFTVWHIFMRNSAYIFERNMNVVALIGSIIACVVVFSTVVVFIDKNKKK